MPRRVKSHGFLYELFTSRFEFVSRADLGFLVFTFTTLCTVFTQRRGTVVVFSIWHVMWHRACQDHPSRLGAAPSVRLCSCKRACGQALSSLELVATVSLQFRRPAWRLQDRSTELASERHVSELRWPVSDHPAGECAFVTHVQGRPTKYATSSDVGV